MAIGETSSLDTKEAIGEALYRRDPLFERAALEVEVILVIELVESVWFRCCRTKEEAVEEVLKFPPPSWSALIP